MQPIPPAFDTAAARGPPEVQAMPARRIGYLILRREQSGVWRKGGDGIVNNDQGKRDAEVNKGDN